MADPVREAADHPDRCPSCGQPPALKTIFPDEPSGHFGTCADKYHDYPWLNEKEVSRV